MTEPTQDIATVDEAEIMPPTNELALWAFEAKQAHLIAQSLANTSFVPASMRGKTSDITGAILAGRELGMKPIAALRSIDIIQGTPALRAVTMRALVQSRGHSIQLTESTDERCVMRGRRQGEEDWQEVEWTIERAGRMGLTAKQQWKIQPKTMLVARATSELSRLIAADVILAMPYTAEELEIDTAPRITLAEISVDSSGRPQIPTSKVTMEEITDIPHTPSVDEPQDDYGWPEPVEIGGRE